jgi:redox-sensitive bicupin YhaK (pirin superfamily)
METIRPVTSVQASRPTLEGAGVRLKRALGFHRTPDLDPFLLLDDFHSSRPDDYRAGFPWHPHRGIETITYMLEGTVAHGDSLGNRGVIRPGEVQWMTAGSGIVHQEMPEGDGGGLLWGFQLWANLPRAHKMMDPRYRDITQSLIPEVETKSGAKVKVVCGQVEGVRGPVDDVVIEPEYLDVTVPAGGAFNHTVPARHTVFAYVFEGAGEFDDKKTGTAIGAEHLVVFGQGDGVSVTTGESGVRFLLISGKPLGEPVAWYGPIVMNTEEELEIAFEEYRNGTFLKHGPTVPGSAGTRS